MNKKRLTLFVTVVLMCMIVARVRAQQATVSVVPASYTVPAMGSTYNVNITVASVEDLYGWALKLYYPNDVLNGTSVTEGPLLKTGGFQTIFLKVNFTDNYNATYGIADLLCIREGNVSGVNGTGTLATITFTSTSTDGPKNLHLANVSLSDSNTNAIPFTSVDGEVTVLPEFPTVVILPLLVASTLVAVTLRKKTTNHRGIFQSV